MSITRLWLYHPVFRLVTRGRQLRPIGSLLVESHFWSRESDEIRLSPSQQRERETITELYLIWETIRYRPANNKKKSRAPSREDATFGHA